MNNAARVSILFALLLPLGLVVHASDAPFIIAQGGLPGQLPGQKPPGQLPGPSAVPAKPATAALPSTGLALPGLPCCSITAVNKTTGIVTAREKSGGRTIEIKATPAQVQNLRVGQDIFVNLQTRQASLDGKTICCSLIFAAATPSLAAPAHGAGTGAGMVAPAANVHHVSHALGLVSIGVHSPPSENAKGEADLSPPKAHKNVPLHGPGKQQQRLADTDDGRKLIQQGVKMLGGITMHASLLGGHKYMVNNCLGMKVSAGNFDLRIPDPDVRFENNAVRISFVIQRISMNALSVRLRPDVGDPLNPCSFSSRIGVGGYAENIRYDITFDPVQDIEACRLGSMGKVEFKYSVGKVRLEPLPPEVGNLAKDMINDALMFISSNTDLNLVDEEMLILNRLLGQKCPTGKLTP